MQPRPRVKVISSGGVVYRVEDGIPLFLLLTSNKRGIWCLPKGLIEENEDEVTTAMREVREETGVSRVKLRGKVGQIKYQFGFRAKTFDKTVHFFLFETDQADAKVGTERMDALRESPKDALISEREGHVEQSLEHDSGKSKPAQDPVTCLTTLSFVLFL